MNLLKINANSPDPALIGQAASTLRAGALAVLPTDTVYGLGVALQADEGRQALYRVKGRDADKAIPVLIASPDTLGELATQLPAYAYDLARRFWPGPLTLVVRAARSMPPAWCASDGSVALRMPACAVTLALIRAVEGPLAVTSANRQGQAPASTVATLDPLIAAQVDLIIDSGPVALGISSTVVSCLHAEPQVLRSGALGL
ncbi:MAG: threonylcarbamoyl-AMP synthase [Coriobacteriales bacterium]|jgi:L-threonylcarbamoyladenylate synthase|nr:threonylcarbamoyl-AMP synthase [Coriobacteriales bacterium]